MIQMSIEDNGPGIPESLHDKILEPLFSTKNFGVGLGMTIVSDIVESHQGVLKHEVPENGGCRFIIWLPVQTLQEDQ
jgi:nitrogen-specific signal transduction histidine kinase